MICLLGLDTQRLTVCLNESFMMEVWYSAEKGTLVLIETFKDSHMMSIEYQSDPYLALTQIIRLSYGVYKIIKDDPDMVYICDL